MLIQTLVIFYTTKKDHDGMVMPIDEVDPIYSQNLTFIRNCLQKWRKKGLQMYKKM